MMRKSVVAYLVKQEWLQDDEGIMHDDAVKRKVFCKLSSINSQEWFEGGRNGLNPQFKFSMFSHDYHGETLIEYEGVMYSIYRTYYKSIDEIELYTEFRKGNEQLNG